MLQMVPIMPRSGVDAEVPFVCVAPIASEVTPSQFQLWLAASGAVPRASIGAVGSSAGAAAAPAVVPAAGAGSGAGGGASTSPSGGAGTGTGSSAGVAAFSGAAAVASSVTSPSAAAAASGAGAGAGAGVTAGVVYIPASTAPLPTLADGSASAAYTDRCTTPHSPAQGIGNPRYFSLLLRPDVSAKEVLNAFAAAAAVQGVCGRCACLVQWCRGGLLLWRAVAVACAVLCCAVLCCAVLCCAVLCCAVLCCAVLCCAVLCCAVLCCAVLCCACAAFVGCAVAVALRVLVQAWTLCTAPAPLCCCSSS
jgi:hypothetical protein